MPESSFEEAWGDLDPRFRACLGQAWDSLVNRGLPVGAVVSLNTEIVSRGRNRVYDPAGGADPLQRTPLAHAEMNALASVPNSVELIQCELWTTHAPCSMCHAAIDFTQIATVQYLATDPSSVGETDHFVSSGRSDDVWIVVGNALFLHNIALVGGRDSRILKRNERLEPEVVSLAVNLLANRTFIEVSDAKVAVEDALSMAWQQIAAAAKQRLERIT